MNLGGLLTEASLQPGNLKHFVLSNRCYQTLRGALFLRMDSSGLRSRPQRTTIFTSRPGT
jgi:hypothetical protein